MKTHNLLRSVLGLMLTSMTIASVVSAQWSEGLGPMQGNVSALYLHGTTVYAGSVYGVFRSDDGGKNFVFSADPRATVNCFAALDTNVLAGCFASGVFKKNADTWVESSNGLSNKNVWAMFVHGSDVYAGTSSGVFISTNQGGQWTQFGTGLSASVNAFVMRADTLWAATNSGIYLCKASDKVWIRRDSGIATPVVKCIVSDQNNLYVGTLLGVYKSTDAGLHWKAANNGLSSLAIRSLCLKGNDIFAATSHGIAKSTQQADSWVSTPISVADSNTTIVASQGSELWASTIANGDFTSSDAGLTWTKVPVAASVVRSLCVHDGKLYCGSFNGVQHSADEGLHWEQSSLNSMTVLDLCSRNGRVFACGSHGVYASTNGQDNWTQLNKGLLDSSVLCFAQSPDRLYLGTRSDIAYSTDNGANWTALSLGFSAPIASIDVIGTTIIACSATKGLLRSSNAGSTWQSVNTSAADTNYTSVRRFDSKLWASTAHRHLYQSDDDGLHWTTVRDDAKWGQIIRQVFSADSTLYVAIDSVGVLSSKNHGATWYLNPLNAGTLRLFANGAWMYAGTNGSGVRRAAIKTTDVQDQEIDRSLSTVCEEMQYNSHDGVVTLHSSLVEATVELWDVQGKLISSHSINNAMRIRLSSFPTSPGLYFMVLRSCGRCCLKSLIIDSSN